MLWFPSLQGLGSICIVWFVALFHVFHSFLDSLRHAAENENGERIIPQLSLEYGIGTSNSTISFLFFYWKCIDNYMFEQIRCVIGRVRA